MRAGQTNLVISVNVSVDLGTERSSVWHYTDVHPLAVTELLSRHCELLNFPVFSPPFNSCSVCASCYTSVPRMCLSDCSQSLGICSAGAGLPEGSTNVWDFYTKLSDSLGVHSVTWLKSEAWSSEFRAKRVFILPLAPLLISCSIAHFIFTVWVFNDTFFKQEKNMKRDSIDGFNNIWKILWI